MHGQQLENGKALSKTPCMYIGCTKEFFHKSKLFFHLENDHGAVLEASNHNFPSMENFRKWKEEVEGEQTVFFSKQFKSTKSSVGTTSHYICQRDGGCKAHRSTTDMDPKSTRRNKKGKVKQGLLCPARMKVLEIPNGGVNVRFWQSHTHPVLKLTWNITPS